MSKVVGVLGGMGPEATVYLMQRIIALTPAIDDVDHIRCIVDNNPKVPSRLKAILEAHPQSPAPVMIDMAKGLAAAGADFIVIPCNTAHYYYDAVAAQVEIPLWNAIESALQRIAAKQQPGKRIVLLASTATHRIRLFESYFAAAGLELVKPDAATQALLMQVIRAVKAGSLSDDLLQRYVSAVAKIQQVDGLLIACSELSMHRASHVHQQPVFDTMEILASDIVASAC